MTPTKTYFKYLIILLGHITINTIQATYPPLGHGTTSIKGDRPFLEDAHFPKKDLTKILTTTNSNPPCITRDGSYIYGLFDGHKSNRAAKYCASLFPSILDQENILNSQENKLMNIFFTINQMYKEFFREKKCTCCCNYFFNCLNYFCCCYSEKIPDDGTTALIALITKNNELFIANAGDSRAVISKNGQAIRLSFDHKPTDPQELNRLQKIAKSLKHPPEKIVTQVINPTTGTPAIATYNILEEVNPHTGFEKIRQEETCVYKMLGKIGICRAIGDFQYEPYITCEPYISKYQLSNNEEFLILGCDGFWDVITDQAAVQLVLYHLAGLKKTRPQCFNSIEEISAIAEKISNILVKKAHELGSPDNSTVTIILFPTINKIPPLTNCYRNSSGSEESDIEPDRNTPIHVPSQNIKNTNSLPTTNPKPTMFKPNQLYPQETSISLHRPQSSTYLTHSNQQTSILNTQDQNSYTLPTFSPIGLN